MNELKKTGLQNVTIGDPWSPNSGNFIHVSAVQHVQNTRGERHSYTEVRHRFKVSSFNEILPKLLELCAKYNAAGEEGK